MISAYVNTDYEFEPSMFHALTRFEFHCCMQLKTETTKAEVSEFLRENYGQEVSDKFKPEMMLKARETSKGLE